MVHFIKKADFAEICLSFADDVGNVGRLEFFGL